MIREYIYTDRDNTIELILKADGAAITHTTITRCQCIFDDANATTIDSNDTPSYFDFTDSTKLTLSLGSAGLAAGNYRMKLIIYTASATNGLVWGDALYITVV